MKLSTADLQALSKIYQATTTQLLAPPEAAEHVAFLDHIQLIVDQTEPDALASWLALGDRLPKRQK